MSRLQSRRPPLLLTCPLVLLATPAAFASPAEGRAIPPATPQLLARDANDGSLSREGILGWVLGIGGLFGILGLWIWASNKRRMGVEKKYRQKERRRKRRADRRRPRTMPQFLKFSSNSKELPDTYLQRVGDSFVPFYGNYQMVEYEPQVYYSMYDNPYYDSSGRLRPYITTLKCLPRTYQPTSSRYTCSEYPRQLHSYGDNVYGGTGQHMYPRTGMEQYLDRGVGGYFASGAVGRASTQGSESEKDEDGESADKGFYPKDTKWFEGVYPKDTKWFEDEFPKDTKWFEDEIPKDTKWFEEEEKEEDSWPEVAESWPETASEEEEPSPVVVDVSPAEPEVVKAPSAEPEVVEATPLEPEVVDVLPEAEVSPEGEEPSEEEEAPVVVDKDPASPENGPAPEDGVRA